MGRGMAASPRAFASHSGIPGRVHVDDQMYRSDAPEHVRRPEFAAAAAEFRAGCATDGAHFHPYRWSRRYGITIHTRAYLESVMAERFGGRLQAIRFAERGWDRHQDVWAYQCAGWGRIPESPDCLHDDGAAS